MLTTHNLEEADVLADRIIVINKGEIVADGTPEAIKGHVSGKYVRFHAPRLTLLELQALPQVQRVQRVSNTFEIFTMQPEALLATLFAQGAQLHDLEVVGAGLEEAFMSITSVSNS